MSKFVTREQYINMSSSDNTRIIKFIHEGAVVTQANDITFGTVSITYSNYNGLVPATGEITIITNNYTPVNSQVIVGDIVISCDADDYTIPCIYTHDGDNVSLLMVVDNVLVSAGDASYISDRDRYKAMLAAKRWIQDHSYASKMGIRFCELPVLNGVIKTPIDFVDYVGLSIYSADGFLLPIYHNSNANTANGYSKYNNSDEYITDEYGICVATYNSPRINNDNPYTYYGQKVNDLGFYGGVVRIRRGELTSNGMYVFDKDKKQFMLSGINTDYVILQYVSDPLLREKNKMDAEGLMINKIYQEALEQYIYYKLIENNRAVPVYEKSRSQREYAKAMKRCEMRKWKISELIQNIRV